MASWLLCLAGSVLWLVTVAGWLAPLTGRVATLAGCFEYKKGLSHSQTQKANNNHKVFGRQEEGRGAICAGERKEAGKQEARLGGPSVS